MAENQNMSMCDPDTLRAIQMQMFQEGGYGGYGMKDEKQAQFANPFTFCGQLPPNFNAGAIGGYAIGVGGGGAMRTTPPQKRKPNPVPAELKDEAYKERRRKNNDSAKRSREMRRQKEEFAQSQVEVLRQENLNLKHQIAVLRNEIYQLRSLNSVWNQGALGVPQ